MLPSLGYFHSQYIKDTTMNHLVRVIVFTALASSCFALHADSATQTTQLKTIFKNIKALNKGAPLGETIAALQEKQTFTEEELLTLCEVATKKLRPYDDVVNSEQYDQLKAFTQTLIAQLQDYKVSGVGFAVHSSFNIGLGRQNFDADFIYKNTHGDVLAQVANIQYYTFGWQMEWVWRFDAIFAVNADLSRFNTRAPIEFTRGFTAGWRPPLGPTWQQRMNGPIFAGNTSMRQPLSVIGVTVLPLKDMSGSLIIAHMGIGITGFATRSSIIPNFNGVLAYMSLNAFNLALVMKGGTFTPQTAVN